MGINELGQPIGAPVPGWTARPRPTARTFEGRYCRLEPLDADRHAAELFAADQHDARDESWTYLPYGPFTDLACYRTWVDQASTPGGPLFFAVIDTDPVARPAGAPTGQPAVGVLSLLRAQPEEGSIEVGHVHYSPLLQRRRGATEAHYLLMRHVFDDLAYRRYEWKCNALNAPSRAAAQRLGFRYEGTFRQANVVKGCNRDTAWYSIIDTEWPIVRTRLHSWLAASTFDAQGRQRTSLRADPVT